MKTSHFISVLPILALLVTPLWSITTNGAALWGDFDFSGSVDAGDIDMLYDNLGNPNLFFDLTDDHVVDQLDVDELVQVILGTEYGDANLDKKVDYLDFSTLSNNFQSTGGWADGNFNGSASVDPNGAPLIDFLDFSALSNNFGFDAS